ncbi:MAG: hypothetical protein S4CHLAM102_06650 [Chlamydiia bacterium]|nr:hypothetical protein [Chlamydiia bacterium]
MISANRARIVTIGIVTILLALVGFLVLWMSIAYPLMRKKVGRDPYFEQRTEREIRTLKKQVKQLKRENAGYNGIVSDEFECATAEQDFRFEARALYLYPSISGTDFAYANGSTSASTPIHGTTEDAKLKTTWGFALGAEYNFHMDQLFVDAEYFHLTSNHTTSPSTPKGGSFVSLKGVLTETFTFANARSNLDLDINAIEVTVNRSFMIAPDLFLVPSIGLTGQFFEIKQNTWYSGGATLLSDTLNIAEESKYWGVGPSFGLDSKWHCYNGVYINAGITGLFPYGMFDVSFLEYRNSNQSNQLILTSSFHQIAPIVQYDVGFGYSCEFYSDNRFLTIGLGYQGAYCFNQNQLFSIDSYNPPRYSSQGKDLSLNGLFISGSLRF